MNRCETSPPTREEIEDHWFAAGIPVSGGDGHAHGSDVLLLVEEYEGRCGPLGGGSRRWSYEVLCTEIRRIAFAVHKSEARTVLPFEDHYSWLTCFVVETHARCFLGDADRETCLAFFVG